MHLSVSDASGDSAVFEYLGGKLVIHHDKKYQVMTNDPSYDQQLALNAYCTTINGASGYGVVFELSGAGFARRGPWR